MWCLPCSASSRAFFVASFAFFFFALATAAAALLLSFVSSALVLFLGIVENRQNLVPPRCTHREPKFEQHAVHMKTSAYGILTVATGFAKWSLTCS